MAKKIGFVQVPPTPALLNSETYEYSKLKGRNRTNHNRKRVQKKVAKYPRELDKKKQPNYWH